jgi:hypothetical protein
VPYPDADEIAGSRVPLDPLGSRGVLSIKRTAGTPATWRAVEAFPRDTCGLGEILTLAACPPRATLAEAEGDASAVEVSAWRLRIRGAAVPRVAAPRPRQTSTPTRR